MRLKATPTAAFSQDSDVVQIALFEQSSNSGPSVGAAVRETLRRRGVQPTIAAWDFLSLALAAIAADALVLRTSSPDGWTREIDLSIAVVEPDRWNAHADELAQALGFLSTDLWTLHFIPGGVEPTSPRRLAEPPQSVALISGGLDSLVGAIDLAAVGTSFAAISQTVRGDGEVQQRFARRFAASHLQLNPNVATGDHDSDNSQRTRSLGFIALALAVGQTTAGAGATTTFYLCENGYIALNPPLTDARLGSLSTRTAHPEFLGRLTDVLNKLGVPVRFDNPYQALTKGEMLQNCLDQQALLELATASTSCGRFQHYNYRHCGRCVPCQVRRAAFLEWGQPDTTDYVFADLGRRDTDHALFDDVLSVTMAVLEARDVGVTQWSGNTLASPYLTDRSSLRAMIGRGLGELGRLHSTFDLL
jgi:hypothetical protein